MISEGSGCHRTTGRRIHPSLKGARAKSKDHHHHPVQPREPITVKRTFRHKSKVNRTDDKDELLDDRSKVNRTVVDDRPHTGEVLDGRIWKDDRVAWSSILTSILKSIVVQRIWTWSWILLIQFVQRLFRGLARNWTVWSGTSDAASSDSSDPALKSLEAMYLGSNFSSESFDASISLQSRESVPSSSFDHGARIQDNAQWLDELFRPLEEAVSELEPKLVAPDSENNPP